MACLVKELKLIILNYFYGFNLFKVNNNVINNDIWLNRTNTEYDSNFPVGSRNQYIKSMATCFNPSIASTIPFDKFCCRAKDSAKTSYFDNIKNNTLEKFVDLAIYFNDIDLAYDLINSFYIKPYQSSLDIFSLYHLGFKLISCNKTNMFNKLSNLLIQFDHQFLKGALEAAAAKADINLIKDLVSKRADTTDLLTYAIASKNLPFFIHIEHTYQIENTIEQLAKAITIKDFDITSYLLTKPLYTTIIPTYLNDFYRSTKSKRLFTKSDVDLYLATFLATSAKEGRVDIVAFLLNFDADFTKTLDYAIICDYITVIDTILNAILQQLSITSFYYSKLDLIKQQLITVMKNTSIIKYKDKLQQFISYLG